MSDNVVTSKRNSTALPIDNGDEFTGVWEDTKNFATLTISALGDENFSVIVEQSNQDPAGLGNTRSVASTETTAVTADTQTDISVGLTGGFVRVRVTNASGSNQTSLTVVTKLLTASAGISTADQAKLDGMAGGVGDLIYILDQDWQMPVASNVTANVTGDEQDLSNLSIPVGNYAIFIDLYLSQEVISSNEMRLTFEIVSGAGDLRVRATNASQLFNISDGGVTANVPILAADSDGIALSPFHGVLQVTSAMVFSVKIAQDTATAGQLITAHKGSSVRLLKL